jgi:hypothetical protein
LDFKISKSQKKVLKRLYRFLSHGDTKAGDDSKSAGGSSLTSENSGESIIRCEIDVLVTGSIGIQVVWYSVPVENCNT